MKSEKLFRAVGQISDEKIAEADVFVTKPVKPIWVRWTPVAAAACLMIAVAIYALPKLWNDDINNPYIGEINEMGADKYDDLVFYFVTEENVLATKTIHTRFHASDTFEKWAELNNVTGVICVKIFLDSNGYEFFDEERGMAGYKVGDHLVLNITLSSEFAAYVSSERGQLLIESLELTYHNWFRPVPVVDDFQTFEFNLIIDEP
jgi:hypothetical protein